MDYTRKCNLNNNSSLQLVLVLYIIITIYLSLFPCLSIGTRKDCSSVINQTLYMF